MAGAEDVADYDGQDPAGHEPFSTMGDTALPVLKGPRVTLRRPVPADVDALLAIGRHAEVVRAYGGTFDPSSPLTRAEAERAIAKIEGERWSWVIDAGGFVGSIGFHSHWAPDRRAALAVGIEDPARLGQGLGTEAVRLALASMFADGLHRASVRVLASNARAIGCYRNCGFVEEGREREAAFVEGEWQDDLVMGLLDREFVRPDWQIRADAT